VLPPISVLDAEEIGHRASFVIIAAYSWPSPQQGTYSITSNTTGNMSASQFSHHSGCRLNEVRRPLIAQTRPALASRHWRTAQKKCPQSNHAQNLAAWRRARQSETDARRQGPAAFSNSDMIASRSGHIAASVTGAGCHAAAGRSLCLRCLCDRGECAREEVSSACPARSGGQEFGKAGKLQLWPGVDEDRVAGSVWVLLDMGIGSFGLRSDYPKLRLRMETVSATQADIGQGGQRCGSDKGRVCQLKQPRPALSLVRPRWGKHIGENNSGRAVRC